MTTKIDGEHHGAHDTGFVGCTEKVRVAFLVNSHGNMYMHLHGCYVYAPACMLQACMQWRQLECLHTSHMHPCVCACRLHTCIHAYVPADNIHGDNIHGDNIHASMRMCLHTTYMHTCIHASVPIADIIAKELWAINFFCIVHVHGTHCAQRAHTHTNMCQYIYTHRRHTHTALTKRAHTHMCTYIHTPMRHTHTQIMTKRDNGETSCRIYTHLYDTKEPYKTDYILQKKTYSLIDSNNRLLTVAIAYAHICTMQKS